MKPLRLIALLALLALMGSPQEANAGGFWNRLLGKSTQRQVVPAQRTSAPSRGRYQTRNLSQGRSRLPSGRSYYQGRYYGNLNNRFYGPQYGYF